MVETALPPEVIRFRQITARGLTAFTGLLALAAIVLEWFMGRNLIFSVSIGIVAVSIAASTIKGAPTQPGSRMTLGAALAIVLMLLIYATRDYGTGPIQEAHMLFFVTNTFLVPLLCVRTQLLYCSLVVAHHLVLTFLAPVLVWDTSDFVTSIVNLGVHAAVVFISVGPLIAMSRGMLQSAIQNRHLLDKAGDLLRKADDSRAQLDAAEHARRQADEDRHKHMAAQAAERERQLAFAGQLQSQLSEQLQYIVSSVTDASQVIRTSAQGLTESSHDMRQANLDMRRTGEGVATTLAGVAASAIELSASVNETSRQAAQAAETSSTAAQLTSQAASTIERLTQSGHEVGSVTDMIGEIASLTNILSINAAVEAARAGESGRGFAVVAGEIRALANRTADATKDIASRIANMVDNTGQVVTIIEAVRSAIDEANTSATKIAHATDAQRAATGEIARNVAEVASMSETSSHKLEGVVGLTERMVSRCDEVLQFAERLNTDVEKSGGEARRLVSAIAA